MATCKCVNRDSLLKILNVIYEYVEIRHDNKCGILTSKCNLGAAVYVGVGGKFIRHSYLSLCVKSFMV